VRGSSQQVFDIMRPLAVLIGIIMGSTFTLFMGLALTWITLLFVPADEAGELFGEKTTLGVAIAVFGTLSAVAGVSFYAQLRERRWRPVAHTATVVCLCAAVWLYWPKK
jgi:FtsH-binding integral membrane protein